MSFVCTLGDQLPLGPDPEDSTCDHPASTTAGVGRPFGLSFATGLAGSCDVDYSAVRYDPRRQISTAYDGERWVPLITLDSPLTVQSTGELGSPNYDEIFDKN